MIRKAFELHGATPAQQNDAVTIARCESGLRPDARNGSNYGLMQINVAQGAQGPRIASLGLTPDQMFNPWWNAWVAAELWQSRNQRFAGSSGWAGCSAKHGIR
jgi:hypothetical protein